jgi:hypothetical protein
MMDVQYFFLARHAEASAAQDGTFSAIGAGVGGLAAPDVPVLLPMFFVLARLALEREDLGVAHNIAVRVLDPTGSQLFASENFDVARNEELTPDRDLLLANMVLGLQNLVFPTFGLYKFELMFDGETVKATRFRVEKLRIPPESSEMSAAKVSE